MYFNWIDSSTSPRRDTTGSAQRSRRRECHTYEQQRGPHERVNRNSVVVVGELDRKNQWCRRTGRLKIEAIASGGRLGAVTSHTKLKLVGHSSA